MPAYYNENDKFAAAWLRLLIQHGAIADGVVDERSIEDVRPEELTEFTQCHFFAGIGGWSRALRLAGWEDTRPAWTGSCPCQPFSTAGKGVGYDDERHLWPSWFHLVGQSKPPIIFGEQVASKAGRAWLNLVQTDMETLGYITGSSDLCAASISAPHWRQRSWFVGMADAYGGECHRVSDGEERRRNGETTGRIESDSSVKSCGAVVGVANASDIRRDQGRKCPPTTERDGITGDGLISEGTSPTGPLQGFWGNADWLYCRDDKWRPVEPGTFPLANGIPGRVGTLRGYGNAIVPQIAQAWIEAVMEELDQ